MDFGFLKGKYMSVEKVDFNKINDLILDIIAEYDERKRTNGEYNYISGMFETNVGVAKLDKYEPKKTGNRERVIRLRYIYRKPDKKNHPPLKDQKNAELLLKIKYKLETTTGTGKEPYWEKIIGTKHNPPVIKMERTRKFASTILVSSLIRSLTNRLELLRMGSKPQKGVLLKDSKKRKPGEPETHEARKLRETREADEKKRKGNVTINIKNSRVDRSNIGKF